MTDVPTHARRPAEAAPHPQAGLAQVLGIFVATGLILFATLSPGTGYSSDSSGVAWCLACGAHGGTDLLVNVLLFLPLGLALGWRSTHFWRWVAAAAALSLLVETSQLLWLPGRAASVGDLIANIAGAMAGVIAGRTQWEVAQRRRVGYVACAVPILSSVIGSMLFRPAALPTARLFSQVAHEFGNTLPYPGHVTEFAVVGRPAPDGPIENADELARHWGAGGNLLEARIRDTAPASGRSQVAGLDDGSVPPPAGIWRTERLLHLQIRWQAYRLRLRGPELILGAVPSPGDSVKVSAHWADGTLTLATDRGLGEGAGTATFRPGPSHGWVVLVPRTVSIGPISRVVSMLWMAVIFTLPVFLLYPLRGGQGLVVAGTILVALGLIPWAAHSHPAPLHEWAAGVLGATAGWGAALGVRRQVTRTT